jgi:hypothetical protein
MDDFDLFAALERDDLPGHRGIDTSVAAAAFIAPHVPRLRARVLEAIRAAGEFGRTSDELAAELGMDRGSVQPRTSGLRDDRLIGDSGRRRKNLVGKNCIVWVAAEHLSEFEGRAAAA